MSERNLAASLSDQRIILARSLDERFRHILRESN